VGRRNSDSGSDQAIPKLDLTAVRHAASKSHWCHSPQTMFTKQVSGGGRFWIPEGHRNSWSLPWPAGSYDRPSFLWKVRSVLFALLYLPNHLPSASEGPASAWCGPGDQAASTGRPIPACACVRMPCS
jgi:hypothetical protein